MLRDTERPADLSPLCLGVVVRQRTNQLRRDTRLTRGDFQRPRFAFGDILFESDGSVRDECFVDQPGLNDLAADAVGQRDVSANVETKPRVGPLSRLGTARVDYVDLGALVNRFQRVMKENRMR